DPLASVVIRSLASTPAPTESWRPLPSADWLTAPTLPTDSASAAPAKAVNAAMRIGRRIFIFIASLELRYGTEHDGDVVQPEILDVRVVSQELQVTAEAPSRAHGRIERDAVSPGVVATRMQGVDQKVRGIEGHLHEARIGRDRPAARNFGQRRIDLETQHRLQVDRVGRLRGQSRVCARIGPRPSNFTVSLKR